MDNQYYLYRHIRLDTNQPFYIGIGTKPKTWNASTFETEYKRALTSERRSQYWRNITSKTSYEVEIMMESDDPEFIKSKEVEFIKFYGKTRTGGILCNITDGGDDTHGFGRTPEINILIAEKHKGKLNKSSKVCYQYDLNGNFVKEYESFNMAASENGLIKQNVLQAKDINIRCGKYYWSDKKYSNIITEGIVTKKPKFKNKIQ